MYPDTRPRLHGRGFAVATEASEILSSPSADTQQRRGNKQCNAELADIEAVRVKLPLLRRVFFGPSIPSQSCETRS